MNRVSCIVLFLVLGLSTAFAALTADTAEYRAQLRSEISQIQSVLKEHKRSVRRQEDNFSQRCREALESVSNDATCSAIFQDGTMVASGEQLCNANCDDRIREVADACFEDNDRTSDSSRAAAFARFFADLICLRDDDGNYCLDTFAMFMDDEDEAANAEQGQDDGLTQADLDIICSDCFYGVVDLILSNPVFNGAFDDDQMEPTGTGVTSGNVTEDTRAGFAAVINLLCITNDNGDYCVLELQARGEPFMNCDDLEGDAAVACVRSNLDFACGDNCFRRFIARAAALNPDVEERERVQADLLFLCVRNNAPNGGVGDYCLIDFTEAIQAAAQACGELPPNNDNQCIPGNAGFTQQCRDAFDQFNTDAGCCVGTVVTRAIQRDEITDDVETIINAYAACGETIPSECPRIRGTISYTTSFIVTIPADVLNAIRNTIMDTLRRDVASFLGIPDIDVTIDSIDSLPGGTSARVTITFMGTTDDETNSLGASLDGAVDAGQMNLPATAQAVSQQSPGTVVSVNNGENGNGAYTIVASLASILAAVIFTVV